jgi:hypothetical protein
MLFSISSCQTISKGTWHVQHEVAEIVRLDVIAPLVAQTFENMFAIRLLKSPGDCFLIALQVLVEPRDRQMFGICQ